MEMVLLRADGNRTTGLGHLYRMIALAEMIKDDLDFVFVTRDDSLLEIIPPRYQTELIPSSVSIENEPQWLIGKFGAARTIIADGYEFRSVYQQNIKNAGYKLIYIDDLAAWHMYADVVINHSPAAAASQYEAEPYSTFATGPAYAILRPAFLTAARARRTVQKIDTALVCFGGADSAGLTTRTVKALLNINKIKSIHVVIGAAFRDEELDLIGNGSPVVKVHRNVSGDALVSIMSSCNFAVSSSSNILYEIASVKMPVLAGYYVENQRSIYEGCLDRGVIFGAGNMLHMTEEDIRKLVVPLLEIPSYDKCLSAQARLIDGRSKQRLLNLIAPPVYRKADATDMLQVFEWANDPVARANSFFPDEIELSTHKDWFARKLKSPDSIIFIALVNGQPAGMIRYEASKENAVVGILVDNKFRGRGLAAKFLMDTAERYFKEFKQPVLAYIKVDNSASIASFEKANYIKLRNEVVQGFESVVYKLERNEP